MPHRAVLRLLAVSALLVGSAVVARAQSARPAPPPDFNREVRPILSHHCLQCHGPDDKQRQAGLRLDLRADALKKLASGGHAVVPRKATASGIVRRIRAKGPLQMPPATANKPLTETQKRVLERWVAAGAPYDAHWAFVPPKAPVLPKLPASLGARVRNPIDTFVFDRLRKAGLTPTREADRTTLIRRVSLDLIGLPPTIAEVDAFLADTKPGAYERLVDRLLASPRYGERWARRWLDLARYADTNGYEKDRPRSVWPYRDWVIRALNADMPFNRFTIEQIAGDLLPGATESQRIATGFHRNTMRNEEGGIDPLEYRFLSMVDRMATTGTTWLGLTVGCAQCHTHKFDPLPHRDYYRLMAFLDNADEPVAEIHPQDIAAKRRPVEAQIARLEAGLASRWPVATPVAWHPAAPEKAASRDGATIEIGKDGAVRVSGKSPEKDVVTLEIPGGTQPIDSLRLEALADPRLGGGGPGRTEHGNFVLTGIELRADGKPVAFDTATADDAQDGFPVTAAIDKNPGSGWAIYRADRPWNRDHTAEFHLARPTAARTWTVVLRHEYGGKHTLGTFRLSTGTALPDPDGRPVERRRAEAFQAAFAAWESENTPKATPWRVLKPVSARANIPTLTIEADGTVMAGGDQSKSDTYTLRLRPGAAPIRALRLEALADPRLPLGGPGRVDYEGSAGDFFLSEVKLFVAGREVKFARARQSFANGGNDASKCIDGDMQTGWGIGAGGVGRSHTAVFVLAEPITAAEIEVRLACERYYASDLGRFRLSVTDSAREPAAFPAEVEALLATPAGSRTPTQRQALENHFAQAAPELAAARAEIDRLRQSLPAWPTALVMQERPAHDPRATFVRRRGEWLQPAERVTPGVPAFLNPIPKGAPNNRLTFARWLVSSDNPLTARVAVNRQWQAFFGRGIVRTLEDFGYQGQPPSHPELLDWLAVRFVKDGWSLKKLHRHIVTSATYRQASAADPVRAARDPLNVLLSRGPRVRLDAELVRDAALSASGLLSAKMYGPSVFPPQPPGVTSEGAYGPLTWTVSTGEDRYRRGLYTFAKRTAPYAMFLTFDAGSGEACLARREVSNTPLQALTLLNDTVFLEAAQALGKQAAAPGASDSARVETLFRSCLTRRPTVDERASLLSFLEAQRKRYAAAPVDAQTVAGGGDKDAPERAAWTLTARAILNLDEAIVKR